MSIAVAAVYYYNNIDTIICVQHCYVILSIGICGCPILVQVLDVNLPHLFLCKASIFQENDKVVFL